MLVQLFCVVCSGVAGDCFGMRYFCSCMRYFLFLYALFLVVGCVIFLFVYALFVGDLLDENDVLDHAFSVDILAPAGDLDSHILLFCVIALQRRVE